MPALQIGRIMDPWTSQAGYPYITVTVTGDSVSVTQKRFLLKNKDHNDNTMWPISMTYSTKESDFASTWPQQIYYIEDGAEKTFRLPAAPENYFIVNNQQTGFYRVNYDADNWMKIKTALNSPNYGGIHVLNRAQIVDDLFNFARAGVVEYGTALDILSYIKTEKSYVPWLAAFNGLTYITRRIVGEEATEEFAHFIGEVLSEVYEEVGYFPKTDDAHTQILLRNNVLNWLCRYGHEDCLQNSAEEFAKFVAQPVSYL
jgi:aminopeptidase N